LVCTNTRKEPFYELSFIHTSIHEPSEVAFYRVLQMRDFTSTITATCRQKENAGTAARSVFCRPEFTQSECLQGW
jgi:hypothetical protein